MSKSMITRLARISALLAAVVSLAASAAARPASTLDPTNPNDAMRLTVKFACSTVDGKPTLYWWKGRVYSHVSGEPDRHLFDVQGMNIRQCTSKTDPVRGFGYRSVSREVMLYLDPKTGEVMRTWSNPWTGKEVTVIQVANDPVNARSWFWAYDEQGKPRAGIGDDYVVADGMLLEGGGAARLFYKNPLAGDYQEYVGGWYHAMEFGSQAAFAAEALDPKDTETDRVALTWGRISKWLPWMEMGDREGLLIFHTAGTRLRSFDELPKVVKDELAKNYPSYFAPPPLDDARPNETSWTVFKRYIDQKRAAEAPAKP
jgi:hypothetical protein